MQTVVKKWFRDKEYGFLDNGTAPDIMVRKADLTNCQFLRIGVNVEFECHVEGSKLVAKMVKLIHEKSGSNHGHGNRPTKPHYFGVMK